MACEAAPDVLWLSLASSIFSRMSGRSCCSSSISFFSSATPASCNTAAHGQKLSSHIFVISLSRCKTRTQPGLDDRDGAAVVLDGRAVLVHVAQRGGHVVVGLGQQAAVGGQVPELQSKALLEVLERLGIRLGGHQLVVFAFFSVGMKRKTRMNPLPFPSSVSSVDSTASSVFSLSAIASYTCFRSSSLASWKTPTAATTSPITRCLFPVPISFFASSATSTELQRGRK
ncbi:hypothetical protein EYF80_054997 [Liparis tanakae]|uniref:Uncharacterized protein n=1 Tax=Liparis tanakae TaxID=230148 RepID=A0A4Z2F0V5_9TELE|nr:hypothetical protein EYF80_054997 [Liparis tanakae]